MSILSTRMLRGGMPSVLCSKYVMRNAEAMTEQAIVIHKSRVKGSAHLNSRLRMSSFTYTGAVVTT